MQLLCLRSQGVMSRQIVKRQVQTIYVPLPDSKPAELVDGMMKPEKMAEVDIEVERVYDEASQEMLLTPESIQTYDSTKMYAMMQLGWRLAKCEDQWHMVSDHKERIPVPDYIFEHMQRNGMIKI